MLVSFAMTGWKSNRDDAMNPRTTFVNGINPFAIAMQHKTLRGRIISYITTNPGSSGVSVAKAVRTPNIYAHVGRMCRDGVLTYAMVKIGRTWVRLYSVTQDKDQK